MNKKFQLNIWQAASALVLALVVGLSIGTNNPNFSFGNASKDRPDFASLSSLYDTLSKRFDGDLDPDKILEGARAGLVSAAGDPYTVYLNGEAAQALQDSLDGTLSGVGIEIGIKNNRLAVISPISGSPADRAGLQAGDYIAAVNDEDTSGMTVDQAVTKIRGEKGTQVKLTIVRGTTQPKEITITREIINVPSVKSEIKPGNIGYIQITQFGSDTDAKFREAAKQMNQAGVKKIILDLRNNPGGYLDTSVDIASHFLAKGLVVVDERRGSTIIDTKKSSGGDLQDAEVVVLINSGSASASEILAGALQDHKRAQLIGEKSFGKGSVQAIEKLGGGSQLKVTVAHWYTPAGRNISKDGVQPDTKVEQTQADTDAGQDPQLDAALKALQ